MLPCRIKRPERTVLHGRVRDDNIGCALALAVPKDATTAGAIKLHAIDGNIGSVQRAPVRRSPHKTACMLSYAHANLLDRAGVKRHAVVRRPNNDSRTYGMSVFGVQCRPQRAKVCRRFFRRLFSRRHLNAINVRTIGHRASGNSAYARRRTWITCDGVINDERHVADRCYLTRAITLPGIYA